MFKLVGTRAPSICRPLNLLKCNTNLVKCNISPVIKNISIITPIKLFHQSVPLHSIGFIKPTPVLMAGWLSKLRQLTRRREPEFEDYVNEIENLFEEEEFDKAIPKVNDLVVRYPDKAQSHLLRGICYFNLREYKYALQFLNQAIELNPLESDPHFWKAMALLESGEQEAGLNCMDEAIRLAPPVQRTFYLLEKGKAFAAFDRTDEAISCFNSLLEEDEEDTEAMFHKCLVLNQQLKYEESLMLIDKALRLSPGNTILVCTKAHTLHGLKRDKEAIDVLNQAVRDDPKNEEVFWIRGTILMSVGMFKEAIEDFDRVLVLEGAWVGEAMYQKARCLLKTGSPTAALAGFEGARAVGFSIQDEYHLIDEALCLYVANRLDEALELVNGILQAKPDMFEGLTVKAQILFKFKRAEEALEYLQKAINLQPKRAAVRLLKAQILESMARNEEALEERNIAKILDPTLLKKDAHIKSWLEESLRVPSKTTDERARERLLARKKRVEAKHGVV